MLEVDLPITDQAKKRAVCSRLLKECAAAAARAEGEDAAATEADAEAPESAEEPACCLLPDLVKLHPTTIPNQMVLLRNEGPRPLLFSVACAPGECGSGGATLLGRSIEDDQAAAAAHQLLAVRPVRGVVPPGQDAQLQVGMAGGLERGAGRGGRMPGAWVGTACGPWLVLAGAWRTGAAIPGCTA